jgi:chromosome partitioning protein
MAVIVIGGEKGGTGKTTLATNLAATRAHHDKDVLIVDTDKQESASSWCYIREASDIKPRISSVLKFGTGIRGELKVLNEKYDDIIVDAGGRDSAEFRAALLVADKAIVPIRATQFDLWTLSRLNRLFEDVKELNEELKVFIVLNAASTNPSVKETEDAISFLKEFPNLFLMKSIIRERIAFHKAAFDGKCVTEIKSPDQKACDEINSLYEEVFNNEV